MSNYIQKTLNPKTGEFEDAEWLDNYFGLHRYGVVFPSDPLKVWKEEEIYASKSQMKRVQIQRKGKS